jgi:hypothetical protein
MRIQLKNVRLSYPHLFTPKAGPDGGTPKFSATFLLDKKKDAAQIKEIQAALAKVHADSAIAKVKIPPDKLCLKDGATKPDSYEDTVMFLNSSNTRSPKVVDRNPSQALTEKDDKVYGGCYVNAVVTLWVQNNSYGKRINASLETVQFVKDGERFGAAPVNPEEEFTNIEDEGDDDPRN